MKRKLRTILLAVPTVGASMALLALPAGAAGYDDKKAAKAHSEQRAQGTNGGQAKSRPMNARANDMRATNLIGKDLHSRDGENIGEIEELLVDMEQGKVVHAVIEADVKDRIGERRVAVPFEKIRAGTDGRLELDADRAQLASFPIALAEGTDWRIDGVDRDRAAARSDRASNGAVTKPAQGKRFTQASAILEADVQDREGKDVGDMEDLVVKLGSGKIHYGVAEFDPSWFEAGKLVAVPIKNMERRDGKLTLVMERGRLEGAPNFDRNAWPENVAEFGDRFERYDRTYAQRADTKR